MESPAPGSNVPGPTTPGSSHPDPAASMDQPHKRLLPNWATFCEASVFVVFAVFFILYGVTPLLGGDGLGLVGADEPRYAQIAHEMLVRFDSAHTIKDRLSACVTPYLYGHPWLEKPALYYWRAMFVFQDFGVHDWSARLPSRQLRLHHGGAHLPAHAAISPRRASGRGADHRGLRRHHRLLPRRVDRHADGRAAFHRAARLVCVVRDRLQVLALRYLLLHRRGHAGQGAGRAISGHPHRRRVRCSAP